MATMQILTYPTTADTYTLIVTIVFLTILFCIGISANSLLLFAFRHRSALHNNSNRLVGNLLVVNLFSTLILIPLICMDIIPFGLWPRIQTSLNHPIRCLLSEFVSSWVSNASMVGTLLIGLDQYLAVMFPLRYSGLVASSKTWIMSFISCMICSLAAIFTTMTEESSLWNVCEFTDTSKLQFDLGPMYSLWAAVSNYISLFLIPFFIISIIYSRIYVEAHANSVRIRRDSNCTLIQGTALVHQMLKCSVKITDRLGTRLESVVDDDLEAVEQQQPLQTTTQRGGRGGGCSGSFHREKVMAARPGLERMPSSAKLLSSIKHKISNASHFMQKHKEELHTAKISLIIVVLVLTCWFPFYTSILVLRMGFFNSKNWPQWMKCLTYLLVATYPSLSPCVFAFRCKKLQLELQRMFQTVPTDFTGTVDLTRNSQNMVDHNELNRLRSNGINEESKVVVDTSRCILNTIHIDTSQRSSVSSHNTTESVLSEIAVVQNNSTELHML